MVKLGLATVVNNVPPVLAQSNVLTGTLFYDTFTDVTGTLLTAHTPDIDVVGGGWQVNVSNFDIFLNRARPVNIASVYANVNKANVAITFNVLNPNAGRAVGALLRYTDSNNVWTAAIIGGNTLQISETNGGVSNVRASTTYNYTSGSGTHNFTISASGTTISVAVSGPLDSSSVSYSSATHNQGATRFGMLAGFGGGFDRFDEYLVIG